MRRLAVLNLSAMNPLSILECPQAPTGMNAGAVILDPPRYSDFFTPMIAAAAARCQLQGHVLVSLPPHGVRPTAPEDREAVLRTASRCGLELVTEYPLALDYETPFFEANALAASGLVAPLQWRRGDLAIFRKIRQGGGLARPLQHRPKSWHEAEISGMRLRILRKPGTTSYPGPLISLLKGDILPTVSRQDPRRRHATVWTSGNRIFATSNPSLLIAAAGFHSIVENRAYRSQTLSGTPNKRDDLWRVNYAFNELACQEAQEEATWRTPKAFDRGQQNWTSKLPNYRSG